MGKASLTGPMEKESGKFYLDYDKGEECGIDALAFRPTVRLHLDREMIVRCRPRRAAAGQGLLFLLKRLPV